MRFPLRREESVFRGGSFEGELTKNEGFKR
jgi:hypothetical protein